MKASSSASLRYRILDYLFRTYRHGLTINELVEKVSDKVMDITGRTKPYSKRTIEYDLYVMRKAPPEGYGAPIVCVGGRFKYSDPNFTIYQMPFSSQDILLLNSITLLLQNFYGLEIVEYLKRIIDTLKIKSDDRKLWDYVQRDFPPDYPGLKYIDILIRAFYDRHKLKMDYQPFGQALLRDIMVDPWLLKEFNGRWYLIGKSSHRNGISNFALDRILRIETLEDISDRPPEDLFEKFSNIIGVSLPDDGQVEEILLKFSKHRYKYVETRKLHKSQQLEKEDHDSCTISVKVIVNKELISLIHYFGPDVEVLAPASLREIISNNYRTLYEKYHDIK